jgi:hypothetical protein
VKTLQEVRKELLVRLGFSDTQGHDNNKVLINGIIEHAQSQLFFQYDFLLNRKVSNKDVVAGSVMYDFPDDCDYRQIIDVVITGADGKFKLLKNGINIIDENNTVRSIPNKYDVLDGQLMVNPIPDKAYVIRFEYFQKPAPLTQDGEQLSLDDEIVFTLALIDLKNHYKMDSSTEQQQFKAQLDKKRDASLGQKRYYRK